MPICLIAGGKATAIALASFTLAWTHSVEKVRWEEDWELSDAGLRIVEARVRGSGAGMEVPDGAVLRDGLALCAEPATTAGTTARALGRDRRKLGTLLCRGMPRDRRCGRCGGKNCRLHV